MFFRYFLATRIEMIRENGTEDEKELVVDGEATVRFGSGGTKLKLDK